MSDRSGWGPQGPQGPYAGGPGGWGWAPPFPPPPPPPKPGVIPLAPLGVDTILSGAFTTVGRYAKPLFGVAGLVYLGLGIVLAGAGTVAYGTVADHVHRLTETHGTAHWSDVRPLLAAFGAVWVLAMVTTPLANAVVQAACVATLHEAVLGRRARLGAVWRRARRRTPSVLGVTVLSGLAVLLPVVVGAAPIGAAIALSSGPSLPLALFFLVAPVATAVAVWLYVLFLFAPAAAVLEDASPTTAMRRSVRLVRGSWWRTFGVSLLGLAIVTTLASLVRMPFLFTTPVFSSYDPAAAHPADAAELFDDVLPELLPFLALTLVTMFLTQLLTSVFVPVVTTLLYVDRRIRREGLADVLARAAATPGTSDSPGTPTASGPPGTPGTPGTPDTPSPPHV
ncbi:oxidoreductase [Streptomyces sp. NPDC007084]|uniref:DUF7847 domain-containing protein n=1 Tax=Streptomyces sp. NPDC007084 TaxID=3154313 RepID=UPI003456A41C